jgi:hypothetical protein
MAGASANQSAMARPLVFIEQNMIPLMKKCGRVDGEFERAVAQAEGASGQFI